MPTETIGTLKTHYVQAGRGPDLVMVHGLASDLAFWYLSIVPKLIDRYRVTVYDLRGHGYSGTPANGYTSADLASDLLALMDHLGVEQPHLIGHSFGGSVALHLATLHPQRVRTLTLADARMHALQPPLPARGSGHWVEIRRRLAEQGLELPQDTPIVVYTVLEELLRGTEGRAEAPDNGPRFWSFGTAGVSQRKLARWIRLVETTSAGRDFKAVADLTRENIASVRQPILAVYGALSGCLESCRGLQRLLPSLSTTLVPGEGHLHPITRPDFFVSHMHTFLEAQGG